MQEPKPIINILEAIQTSEENQDHTAKRLGAMFPKSPSPQPLSRSGSGIQSFT
jgi:hypothetical protein